MSLPNSLSIPISSPLGPTGSTTTSCTPLLAPYKSPWPNIRALNFENAAPCKGFVKKSAAISWVLLYLIFSIFFSTKSITWKSRMLIWRVRFEDDTFPFVSKRIADLLSWYNVATPRAKPLRF